MNNKGMGLIEMMIVIAVACMAGAMIMRFVG